MLTKVTLSASEFKDLHNAKCDLYQMARRLADSGLAKDLAADLAAIERQIEKSLKGAYRQEEKVRVERQRHYDAFSRLHGMVTIWSLQEVEDLAAEHPFLGATKLTYKDHWGPKEVSVEIKGNLWSDLWKAADEAMRASGDMHHVFIEAFRKHKTDKNVLVLSTGS